MRGEKQGTSDDKRAARGECIDKQDTMRRMRAEKKPPDNFPEALSEKKENRLEMQVQAERVGVHLGEVRLGHQVHERKKVSLQPRYHLDSFWLSSWSVTVVLFSLLSIQTMP